MMTPELSYASELGARSTLGGIAAQDPYSDELDVEHLEFAPFDTVLGQLMSHPLGLSALHGHDTSPDWDQLLDCGCEPRDPNERMRWKITKAAYDEIKPFLKEREEHLKRYTSQRNYHASLAALKQNDPLFERTMLVMEHYLGKLPQVIKNMVMPVLARDFRKFVWLYEHLREAAVVVENHAHHKRRKEKRKQEGGAGMHAPGTGRTAADVAARDAERRALVARVKAGGAKEGDLLRYLELVGAGE